MEGTETVHWIRAYDPPNTIGPDIDDTKTRDADGFGLFAGFPKFDLQSNGTVLQLRLGDRVQATSHRTSDAD